MARNRGHIQGLTLLELLVVILIVALLVGILLPVISGARKYSYQTNCISNIRQIHLAWTLYIGDYGGNVNDMSSWPRWRPLANYVKDNRVLVCPLDPAGGWWRIFNSDYVTSYAYLAPSTSMTTDILRVDPNPGVVACYLHGQCQVAGRIFPHCKGLVLRIRIDGSLRKGHFPVICHSNGYGMTSWFFFTDEPCPPRYLGGGTPCDPPSW